jgi:hypothetical protein
MSSKTHPPETDLIVPLPGPTDQWDPHTIHTHYFGLAVPEAQIGVFIYIRYMPYFPLCQGGIIAFQGMDNLAVTDAAFCDYQITMPWPEMDGSRITTANGLSIAFPEPGRRALITYTSTDGRTALDIEATAVSPLAARGHVVPGEELHTGQESGGTEQFVRCTGELVLHGERHAVDCHTARDRSWRQVRSESRDANLHPPVTWTPIWFGEDLAFNQVGIEAPDTDPAYAGVYDIPAGAPTHHFAWVSVDGEVRNITRVRRSVSEYHPQLFAPLKMEIEAEDEAGDEYHITGEAIAFSPIMMWPNIAAFDSIFRWQDATSRTAFGSAQTMHVEAYAHALKTRHRR